MPSDDTGFRSTSERVAAPRVAPEAIRDIAPALADYTDAVLFADVWARPELSARDRSLVTISALTAMGDTPQLRSHLGRGLDNGLTPDEISAALTHLAFYAGWPKAMSAVLATSEVFAQRGLALSHEGETRLDPVAGEEERAQGVATTIAPIAPNLAAYTNQLLFDEVWRRDDLTPRDRSLVTLSSLISTGAAGQLAYHLGLARSNGLTRSEAVETATHLAFYAGWPKAMSAVPAIGAAFEGAQTLDDPGSR
ncbi:hypothetical protein LTR94_026234 [Friedmanniomyces endolithicus]|nr:hypothetical protein LTR94_026234 [Friedmanniomyces endolithicus]